jgi:hypothetical protein
VADDGLVELDDIDAAARETARLVRRREALALEAWHGRIFARRSAVRMAGS